MVTGMSRRQQYDIMSSRPCQKQATKGRPSLHRRSGISPRTTDHEPVHLTRRM